MLPRLILDVVLGNSRDKRGGIAGDGNNLYARFMTVSPSDARPPETDGDRLVPKRRPGRPSRLTPDQILDATIEMLAEGGLPTFTMNRLAQRLNVPVMTIYSYFSGREMLLDTAAERIFGSFDVPEKGPDWRASISAWLVALYDLFERYPVGLRLIKWDGDVTPSWMRVWLPMLRILSREGLTGERLAFASEWIGRVATGLLTVQFAPPTHGEDTLQRFQNDTAPAGDGMFSDRSISASDRVFLVEALQHAKRLDSRKLYDFGADTLLRSLEVLLA